MTDLWCVGCGLKIWSGPIGPAGLAVTCVCGAHALRDADGRLVWPASFYLSAGRGGHVEYMLGWSSYSDLHKTRAEETLVAAGYTRAEECRDAECRERIRARREKIVASLRRRPQDLDGMPLYHLCELVGLPERRLAALLAEAGLRMPRGSG